MFTVILYRGESDVLYINWHKRLLFRGPVQDFFFGNLLSDEPCDCNLFFHLSSSFLQVLLYFLSSFSLYINLRKALLFQIPVNVSFFRILFVDKPNDSHLFFHTKLLLSRLFISFFLPLLYSWGLSALYINSH